MAYPSMFDAGTKDELVSRLDKLTPDTQRLWGKMGVAQMLAHCGIPFQQAFGERKDAPPLIMKWVMRTFFKSTMTNEVPYKKNLPTSPAFVIRDEKKFDEEREKLKHYVRAFQEKGADAFDGHEQLTLGKLTASEWSNMMYKHLDHHLRQFGV